MQSRTRSRTRTRTRIHAWEWTLNRSRMHTGFNARSPVLCFISTYAVCAEWKTRWIQTKKPHKLHMPTNTHTRFIPLFFGHIPRPSLFHTKYLHIRRCRFLFRFLALFRRLHERVYLWMDAYQMRSKYFKMQRHKKIVFSSLWALSVGTQTRAQECNHCTIR